MTRRPRQSDAARRSFVIMSVFVIVVLALLLVTGMIFLSQSEAAARVRTAQQTQLRADAWSAAQVIMGELNRQRDRVLEGELPEIEQQYTLHESQTAAHVVRLLPSGHNQQLLTPEAAKLDLNESTAEQLAATNVVESATAERVIAARDNEFGGTFRSVGDLCRVDGLSPSDVFGSIDRAFVRQQTQRSAEGDSTGSTSMTDTAPQALIDVATVYSHEPALQRIGNLRINLNVQWSDELGRRVNDRFGEGSAQVLKNLFEQMTFDDDSKIIDALLRFGVPLDESAEILDVLTTESGDVHFGRVDINTASAQVLAALPGIEPEQAVQIVQVRDGLSADERWTITWPATAGVIEPQAYTELAGRITTRSWTYRVRFAVGSVSPDEPNGPMREAGMYEMVIDLSGPEPRIAYLRDISTLQTTAMIAADATARGIADDMEDARSDETGNDPELASTALDRAGSTGAGAESNASTAGGLDSGPQPGSAGRNSSRPRGGDETSSERDGRNIGGSPRQRRRIGRWQGG